MIIETLGLCYHLHCFKVSPRRRACRPRRFAWRAHGFCEPPGCGLAANKLGAVTCQSVLRWSHKLLATALFSNWESSYSLETLCFL